MKAVRLRSLPRARRRIFVIFSFATTADNLSECTSLAEASPSMQNRKDSVCPSVFGVASDPSRIPCRAHLFRKSVKPTTLSVSESLHHRSKHHRYELDEPTCCWCHPADPKPTSISWGSKVSEASSPLEHQMFYVQCKYRVISHFLQRSAATLSKLKADCLKKMWGYKVG